MKQEDSSLTAGSQLLLSVLYLNLISDVLTRDTVFMVYSPPSSVMVTTGLDLLPSFLKQVLCYGHTTSTSIVFPKNIDIILDKYIPFGVKRKQILPKLPDERGPSVVGGGGWEYGYVCIED